MPARVNRKERRSRATDSTGTKETMVAVMKGGMIFPKRAVMCCSALAWASVGSRYSVGWNPTRPPNSLPVSTPVKNRLAKRAAFKIIFLSPLPDPFPRACRRWSSVADHDRLSDVAVIVKLIQHEVREIRPADLPKPAATICNHPVVATLGLVGVARRAHDGPVQSTPSDRLLLALFVLEHGPHEETEHEEPVEEAAVPTPAVSGVQDGHAHQTLNAVALHHLHDVLGTLRKQGRGSPGIGGPKCTHDRVLTLHCRMHGLGIERVALYDPKTLVPPQDSRGVSRQGRRLVASLWRPSDQVPTEAARGSDDQ